MSEYSGRHFDILLSQMLRHTSIMELASQHLQASFFQDEAIGGNLAQALMFDVIKKFYEVHRQAPDRAVICTEVEIAVNRMLAPEDPIRTQVSNHVSTFYEFFKVVDDHSLPMARKIVEHMRRVCVAEMRAKAVVHDALRENRYADGLAAKLATLENEQKSLLGGATLTGVGSLQLTDVADRVMTGIPFIDSKFGGGRGPMSGCAFGIIAGQGDGKTTLGVQMCVAQCLMGNPALLVLLEEGFSGSLQRNVRACATGIPTLTWESAQDDPVKVATLSGVSLELIKKKLEMLDKFLEVLDLVADPGGFEKIEAEVARMCMLGKKPLVIYIDWAGLLADYMLSNPTNLPLDSQEAALKKIGDLAASLGARYKTLVVVAQQLAPALIYKGPTFDYNQFCAAGCKGFTQSFKYAAVIGPRDKVSQVQRIRYPKTRNDPPNQSVLVKLRGEIAQFCEAVGYEMIGKIFKPSNAKAASGSLPMEAKA